MSDTELRGIVLQKFYDLRRKGPFQWPEINDDKFFELVGEDLLRICEQLSEHGLINWESIHAIGHRGPLGGNGMISAYGIDVIEKAAQPPIAISFDSSIHVHSSSHVQIGNANTLVGNLDLGKLLLAIDHSEATDHEKAEAKSLFRRVWENPLTKAILGKFTK